MFKKSKYNMKNLTISSILLAMVFMFAACGGGDTAEQTQDDSQQDMQEEAVADDGVRTIEVVGIDDLKYVVSEGGEGLVTGGESGQFVLLEAIEASPGEEIRITLRTVSNLPPTAMSHNMVILEMQADTDAFARASIQASDSNYIPSEYVDLIIASTDMLGDGESDTITFTVPEETGEYDYICSFPGHYNGGMVGQLIVSE